jgi:hypothetical protein
MSGDDSLEKYVQKWVLVDNQIQLLQEKTKTMREWKHKLTDKIVEIMETKGIEDKVFEIPNGELFLQEKREYSTLSFGYIEDCLQKLIPDPEQADFVLNYLREHREIKMVKDIRRKNLLPK